MEIYSLGFERFYGNVDASFMSKCERCTCLHLSKSLHREIAYAQCLIVVPAYKSLWQRSAALDFFDVSYFIWAVAGSELRNSQNSLLSRSKMYRRRMSLSRWLCNPNAISADTPTWPHFLHSENSQICSSSSFLCVAATKKLIGLSEKTNKFVSKVNELLSLWIWMGEQKTATTFNLSGKLYHVGKERYNVSDVCIIEPVSINILLN